MKMPIPLKILTVLLIVVGVSFIGFFLMSFFIDFDSDIKYLSYFAIFRTIFIAISLLGIFRKRFWGICIFYMSLMIDFGVALGELNSLFFTIMIGMLAILCFLYILRNGRLHAYLGNQKESFSFISDFNNGLVNFDTKWIRITMFILVLLINVVSVIDNSKGDILQDIVLVFIIGSLFYIMLFPIKFVKAN